MENEILLVAFIRKNHIELWKSFNCFQEAKDFAILWGTRMGADVKDSDFYDGLDISYKCGNEGLVMNFVIGAI